MVVLGGLSSVAAAPPVPNLDAPATLGPNATHRHIELPVESLLDVRDLDLQQPAQVELPKYRVARRIGSNTEAPIAMPALVAPTNEPTKPAPTTTKSDDQPPTVPDDFQPEWRSSGKGQKSEQVTDAFKLPADQPATNKSDTETTTETKSKPDTDAASKSGEDSDDDSPTKTSEPVEQTEPAVPLKPLTRNQIYLRNRLRKVLNYYYRKPLNSRDHDAWEVMHGMLAYELRSRIRAGHPRGESMTAIGWLCYNNPCKRKVLMRLNDEGEIRAQYGVGLQGHMGQFLAMLAQCNVDPSYPIRVEGKEFTINDLIESEKETCYPKTELTFKLIGLMHYLPSDAEWVNDRGENWSIERLIEEEIKQPIRGAACGGTHRLGGLSLAVRKRRQRGESIDGAFLKAQQFTNRYEQYAYRLQNNDGSFSTEWFRGPGRERDIDRRCRTSGHLLEWILYHIEDEKLTSYRVVKGVNYLTNLLYSNSDNEWETGPICHALHALAVYDKRVFQPHDTGAQTVKANTGSADQAGNSSARVRRGNPRNTSASRSRFRAR